MASIQKIQGAKGASYKITVATGRDSTGKQIRHTKTWKPDRPMTAKQAEKEARIVAAEFERQIETGFAADDRQTFEEYALYVLDVKKQEGASLGAQQLYERLLKQRIFPAIGFMKLRDIRPQHLTTFYKELRKPGQPMKNLYVTPKPLYSEMLEKSPKTIKQIAAECGLNYEMVCHIRHPGKRTRLETVQPLAKYFNMPVNSLFEIEGEDATLSVTYIRIIHRLISTIFAQAEKEMILQYNPAKRATVPAEEQYIPDYFQPEQLKQILSAAETEPIMWRTMLNLFIVTGCRRGEIAGLKWGKVDFGSRQLLIDCSLKVDAKSPRVYEGPTKTKNKRYITLPAEIISMLKKYRVWQIEERLRQGSAWTESDYIFTSPHGGPIRPTSINMWLYGFSERHGLPKIHPHSFRHSCATVLISEGVDIVTVSKLMGHSNPSMTVNTYAHAVEEAQRKATECITDILLRKERA